MQKLNSLRRCPEEVVRGNSKRGEKSGESIVYGNGCWLEPSC